MPVDPPELEDFEAALGTDRHCQRPDTYSRVSAMAANGSARASGSAPACCVNLIDPLLDQQIATSSPLSLLLRPPEALTLHLGGIYCGPFSGCGALSFSAQEKGLEKMAAQSKDWRGARGT